MPPNRSSRAESDARRELIIPLWEKGLSASEIAVEIGASRNVVIGIVSRAKLPKRDCDAYRNLEGWRRSMNAKPPKPKVVPPEPIAAEAPPSLHLDVEQLNDSICHWPYGDYGYTFCGHPAKYGKLYCSYHHAIGTVPLKPKAA